tara:strand:- start:108 stop:413 length:306 start_codon:yes stop_codon:yes gene_type:complete
MSNVRVEYLNSKDETISDAQKVSEQIVKIRVMDLGETRLSAMQTASIVNRARSLKYNVTAFAKGHKQTAYNFSWPSTDSKAVYITPAKSSTVEYDTFELPE